MSGKKLKSINIWRTYKQERDCLVHFARLANTLLNDEESARDNHVLACNFAKYSPILKTISVALQVLSAYPARWTDGVVCGIGVLWELTQVMSLACDCP